MGSGRCAGKEATGPSCIHQFRIGTRNGQQSALQPHHSPIADCPANVRLRGVGGGHVTPQQHSSG